MEWQIVPSPSSVVVMVPMSSASHSCKPFTGLMCVFMLALSAGCVSRAQSALPSGGSYASAPVPAPRPSPAAIKAAPAADSSPFPGLNHDSSGSAHGRTAPHAAVRGFSLWDRTLLEATQPGEGIGSGRFFLYGGLLGSPRTGLHPWGDEPNDLESLFRGARGTSPSTFGRGQGSGGLGAGRNGAAPGNFKFNQLTRGNPGMYMKSPVDSFFAYDHNALGTRSNGLGVAAGQGSFRATYNSSTFGNGMFNFTATTMVGSGPAPGSMRVGSGSGAGIGGPSGTASSGAHPTASLSLRLHF